MLGNVAQQEIFASGRGALCFFSQRVSVVRFAFGNSEAVKLVGEQAFLE
jgi:hypothetical protein